MIEDEFAKRFDATMFTIQLAKLQNGNDGTVTRKQGVDVTNYKKPLNFDLKFKGFFNKIE